jgi:Ca-activated chloride channel homolog
MKRLPLLPVLYLATAAAHAAGWSDLWLTRDQQAQRLLDSNQPGPAASLFSDARHQAYAQLQAGYYSKAAALLAPFKDADSLYNRGNALAHTGQLREALKSYDAALAATPGNRDVIHNRELVKRALEQQNAAQQQKGGSQSGDGAGQKGAKGSNDGSSGSQGGPGRNQDAGAAQSQAQAGSAPQDNPQAHTGSQSQANTPSQPGSRAGSRSQSGGQAHSGDPTQSGNQTQPRDQRGTPSQTNAQSSGTSQAPDRSGAGSPAPTGGSSGNNALAQSQAAKSSQLAGGQASGPDADTARRDATAGIRYQQSQAGASGTKDSVPGHLGTVDTHKDARVETNTPPPQPPSEQSLALDQWLRGIPEDSGELLRRKFLIEHMMRQQGDAQ